MADRVCYHCKQTLKEGEEHDCWTTTEAALTKHLSGDLLEADLFRLVGDRQAPGRATELRQDVPSGITRRNQRDLGIKGLIDASSKRLPASDLRSILIEVHMAQADSIEETLIGQPLSAPGIRSLSMHRKAAAELTALDLSPSVRLPWHRYSAERLGVALDEAGILPPATDG